MNVYAVDAFEGMGDDAECVAVLHIAAPSREYAEWLVSNFMSAIGEATARGSRHFRLKASPMAPSET